jgi:hypothetical protein
VTAARDRSNKRDTDEEDERQDEDDPKEDLVQILFIPASILFIRVPLV